MSVPVVALYGSLAALLNVMLAARVSLSRLSRKVSLGVDESKEMLVITRTHANNAEYTPVFVVMLLVAELMGGSSTWLHVFGGAFVTVRLSHVIGMPRRAPNPFRFVGSLGTYLTILGVSVYALLLRFG